MDPGGGFRSEAAVIGAWCMAVSEAKRLKIYKD
jgi:hypothetical protein